MRSLRILWGDHPMERLSQFHLELHDTKRNAFQKIKCHCPSHEPFIRKRQRTAAVQDASEGQVPPGFRKVLDCASPLALWLPLQKWVHGSDVRPMLEVEALHESGCRA